MNAHPPGRKRRWPAAAGRALLVFALYLGAAVLVTWPLATHLDTQLIGHPFSDTTEYTRHIWRIAESLRAGQFGYFTYDPLLLYPNGITAYWLWSAPLQSFPQALLALALPLAVAHNGVALVTLALNGLAMWALMRWLLRPHPPTPSPWGEGENATAPDGADVGARHTLPLQTPSPDFEALTPNPSPSGKGEDETAPDGADVGARHALPLLQTPSPDFEALTPNPSPSGRGEYALDDAGDGGKSLSTQHSALSTSVTSTISLPAFLAGLVFAIYPAFQGQLGAGHTGLLVLWPMPLYILCFMRAAHSERPRWGWIAAAGALFAVSQWGNLLLLLYLVLPFTALYLLALVWQRRWRGLVWALLAVGFGVLCSLPFALPILGDAAGGAVAREDGVVRYSASLLTIAAPSFYNPLYSGMAYNRAILGRDPFEGAGYAGLFAAALAVLAAVKIRRARFWLLLAALAWVASLGPLLKVFDAPLSLSADGHPSYVVLPWALVQNLPVLSLIRTPARFNFTVGLAIAVLVGYGAFVIGEWATRRWSRRAANGILVFAALLIVVDFQWFAPMPTIDAGIPAAVRALGEDPSIRAVFDIPWQHPLTDKDALYLQTGHGLPLIGGHITRRTPLDPATGMLLQESLDPYLLDAAGVDIIILHKQWDGDPAARAGQMTEHFGPPLYDDDRIAVWRVAHETDAAPRFVTVDQLTGTLTDSRSLYFFVPEAGEAALTLTLNSATPRHLSLTLDGEPVRAPFTGAPFVGEGVFTVPLTFGGGMHTLTLAADPPCPPEPYPALECAAVEISAVTLDSP